MSRFLQALAFLIITEIYLYIYLYIIYIKLVQYESFPQYFCKGYLNGSVLIQFAVKLYGKCVCNAGQASRITRNYIGQRVKNLRTNQIEDTSKTGLI